MTKAKSTKRRRWPWIVLAVAVIGIGLLAFSIVSGMRNQMAAISSVQAQSGQVVVATIGDLSAGVTASGHIAASREARLSLGISGGGDQVNGAVGDTVQAGDILVQLETAAWSVLWPTLS